MSSHDKITTRSAPNWAWAALEQCARMGQQQGAVALKAMDIATDSPEFDELSRVDIAKLVERGR